MRGRAVAATAGPGPAPVQPDARDHHRLAARGTVPSAHPEDFAKIWAHLSGGRALFAAVLVSTGARYGEAAEIRVRDVNFRTNEFSISRRLVQTGGRNNDGSRFSIFDGTKAGKKYGRTIVLPQQVADDLRQWIEGNGLTEFDLIFPPRLIATEKRAVDLGRTGKPFTAAGSTYHHGTPYGYTGSGCRCAQCIAGASRRASTG